MNLKVYLMMHGMNIKQFAKMLECSPAYLSLVINGHQTPSKRFSKHIEIATDGMVKREEIAYKPVPIENKIIKREDFFVSAFEEKIS